jgi:hypothetical protein
VSKDETDWSAEELKALLNQALALEFVKLKRQPESPQSSKFLSFLQSSSGTALITVLLGGLLGTILSSRIQESSRKNDESRARLQAGLQAEQKTVEEAAALVGRLTASSNDLIEMTDVQFDQRTAGLDSEYRTFIAKQKEAYYNAHNAALTEWTAQKTRIGLLLAIEHPANPDIQRVWENLANRVESFSVCSEAFNTSNPHPTTREMRKDICSAQRASLETGLQDFAGRIVSARQTKAP